MKLGNNITYWFVSIILPLLMGEEHLYPQCEWEKTKDCVTKISVYSIENKSFEVFQLLPGNMKGNLLHCDWIENHFICVCSIFKCNPPIHHTFHAIKSSTGKCLNVTNLQLSYDSIHGIKCAHKEYERTTSPPIVNKSSDEKPSSNDNSKVWLSIIVIIAILIALAVIGIVAWKCCIQHRKAEKKSQKKEDTPSYKGNTDAEQNETLV